MFIAWAIKLLMFGGLSEAAAVATATSKWVQRALAVLLTAIALLLGFWYLTHLGGKWKEQEIQEFWAEKNRLLAEEQRKLTAARSENEREVQRRVGEAIQSIQLNAECSLSPETVRRLDSIARGKK